MPRRRSSISELTARPRTSGLISWLFSTRIVVVDSYLFGMTWRAAMLAPVARIWMPSSHHALLQAWRPIFNSN